MGGRAGGNRDGGRAGGRGAAGRSFFLLLPPGDAGRSMNYKFVPSGAVIGSANWNYTVSGSHATTSSGITGAILDMADKTVISWSDDVTYIKKKIFG